MSLKIVKNANKQMLCNAAIELYVNQQWLPWNLSMWGDATGSSCNKLHLLTMVLGTEDLLLPEHF